MEGRYMESSNNCQAAERVLHYPDFDLLAVRRGESVIVNQADDTNFSKTRKKASRLSRKASPKSKHAKGSYRKRLIQLLLTAIALTFIFGGIGVHADPKDITCSEDEFIYKIITVEQGDTLWDIADTWSDSTNDDIRTYIENIREMNHLHGDRLQDGQLLLIYYGKSMEEMGQQVVER